MTTPELPIEVVLAHYNEDVSWRHRLDQPSVLVSKSSRDADLFVPENLGHEALCYLQYIIERYPRFPRHVAFVHAHEDSDHQEFSTPVLLRFLRLGKFPYVNLNRRDWYTTIAPVGDYAAQYAWISEFWRGVAESTLGPLPPRIEHYASAQFVVSRHRILARPLAFYVACAQWIRRGTVPNYQSGRVFEYCWHIIFGEPPIEPRLTREQVWAFPPHLRPRQVRHPGAGGWTLLDRAVARALRWWRRLVRPAVLSDPGD